MVRRLRGMEWSEWRRGPAMCGSMDIGAGGVDATFGTKAVGRCLRMAGMLGRKVDGVTRAAAGATTKATGARRNSLAQNLEVARDRFNASEKIRQVKLFVGRMQIVVG